MCIHRSESIDRLVAKKVKQKRENSQGLLKCLLKCIFKWKFPSVEWRVRLASPHRHCAGRVLQLQACSLPRYILFITSNRLCASFQKEFIIQEVVFGKTPTQASEERRQRISICLGTNIILTTLEMAFPYICILQVIQGVAETLQL